MGFINSIGNFFKNIINNIGDFFKNIVGCIGDFFKKAFTGIIGIFNGCKNHVIRFFKKTNNIFHGKSDFNYNVDGMMSDFQYVRNVIEKTTNPLHFAALNNLVNAFERKWKPIEPNGAFGYIVRKNSDYEYAVQYLHLKLKYEYEIPAI